jgi:hypothetical protein
MENKNNLGDDECNKDIDFEFPESIRWMISLPTIVLILSILGIYIYLVFFDPDYIDPEKYGLPIILIPSIIILIVINMPWNKLGFRIKKIGIIELEQAVKIQAKDNSKELADLQSQIDKLKRKMEPTGIEIQSDNSLDILVKKFLGQYNQWAFSSSRIKEWGTIQNGFTEFKNYEIEDIQRSLRRLIFKKDVVTRMSRKGNTIYKIK